MQVSKTSGHQNSESESEDATRFDKSLQELKELRSQLHHAADYCEKSFLNAKEKKLVLETTKEYICRAVVTVVDHVGCVSSNLNSSISKTNAFSDAEHSINCLKQRLTTCQEYAHQLALARIRWNSSLPKVHRRYLSTPILQFDISNEDARRDSSSSSSEENVRENGWNWKRGFEAEDLPMLLHTRSQYTSSSANKKLQQISINDRGEGSRSARVAVRDGLSILSKGRNPTFHFQVKKTKLVLYYIIVIVITRKVVPCVGKQKQEQQSGEKQRKTAQRQRQRQSGDIFWLSRRAKTTSSSS
ncbi:hypothetical protein K2173_023667 [Erythroxylum novogranatense]|uniref:Protein ABIL5 n=1 Tax=Erythroxylum novogranatense TaxID=1862640 RepID=A0AAV8TPP7_9ROSI|nr:hypothetical protein K2173_023667 [Erythroxylum novogranatense]